VDQSKWLLTTAHKTQIKHSFSYGQLNVCKGAARALPAERGGEGCQAVKISAYSISDRSGAVAFNLGYEKTSYIIQTNHRNCFHLELVLILT
jgi:hypothetical protein